MQKHSVQPSVSVMLAAVMMFCASAMLSPALAQGIFDNEYYSGWYDDDYTNDWYYNTYDTTDDYEY